MNKETGQPSPQASDKTAAQRRADDIRVFGEELRRLEAEGVLSLSDGQQRAIQDYHDRVLGELAGAYDIDLTVKAKQLSLGMRIASFLGALAFSASVFFLFYQFWGLLATTVQVSILVAAPVIMLAVTLIVARYDPSGYFVKLAALVCFVCFVLNIAMLGEIFNLTPSDNAFVVWAAFAGLLAYAFNIRLLLVVGILCIGAFIAARAGTWSGLYWLHFGERPENFFAPAAVLFLIPTLFGHQRFAGFAPLYRVFALLFTFLPMLVLANWGRVSYLPWDEVVIEGLYQSAGFVLSAVVIWQGIQRQWNDVTHTGTVFFVLFLYTKVFDWWWDVLPKYLFFLIIGLTALLLLSMFRRLRHGGRAAPAGRGA